MMSIRSFTLAAVLLLASGISWAQVAGCVPAKSLAGGPRSGFAGLHAGDVDMVIDVHRRISAAAKVEAELYLCPSRQINAFAAFQGGTARILVNAGLVVLVEGDRDQLAAVLGHEIGHVRLRHNEARARAARDAYIRASREAQRQVQGGADTKTAAQVATHGFFVDFTQFSQVAEREADDAGFKYLMTAGFKASGQRELAEKMLKASAARERAYFSTHPGWAERAGYSGVLQKNEEFRVQAEELARAKRFRDMAALVQRWQKEIPDSGAAAFYRGIHRWMASQSQTDVSAAFEDAVAFFDGEGLSRLSQEYQAERRDATVALCVSLYREGLRVQALHCLDRLDSRADLEAFKKITGWSDFILVARPKAGREGSSLYSGRNEAGAIVLSNCPHVADANGLRGVRPWAAARPGAAAAAPEKPGAMVCSPNMCNCEPADLEELLESVKRPAR